MANAAGKATRQRLILVAEELFARHGLDAVPLREIASAAGQRNVAATNYYFKDRDGLIQAIFEHRLEAIEEHQEQLLAETLAATASGSPERVRGLIEAFVLPLTTQLAEGHFLGFIARLQLDFGRGDQYIADRLMRATRLIAKLLRSEFEELPDDAFERRMRCVYILGVHYLATVQLLGNEFETADGWHRDLVDILVGVMRTDARESEVATPKRLTG
jgi:AcrR family transcriptional regulator